MDKNTRYVIDKLWNDLVQACRELGYLPTCGPSAYLEYNRLVFSEKYQLLTFEVRRGRLLSFSNRSSMSNEDLDRLRRYFNSIRLDVVDLGPNLYFNLWIGSIGQLSSANSMYA